MRGRASHDWSCVAAELWGERSRVGLVALGVLWGTLSLGLLLAFGRSMTRATNGTVANFGEHLLRLSHGATTMPFEGLPPGRQVLLEPGDTELLATVPGAVLTSVEYSTSSQTVFVGSQRHIVRMSGVSAPFVAMRNQRARPGGRTISERDVREHRRVCFLGHDAALQLFGSLDVIGRTVEMAGVPLKVVGAADSKVTISNYNGRDDQKITVPWTLFRDLNGWRYPSFLWVQLEDGERRGAALEDVRRKLGAQLRFDPADVDAIEVQDYIEMREMVDSIVGGNRLFTAVVGVLGLLVSAVGVANVMLSLVEERRTELGVQLALGARPGDLARERLVEGVLVTTVGGAAGLVLCAGLVALLGVVPLPTEVTAYLGQPRIEPGLAVCVLGLLVTTGALAGWIPAREAARLDPATVLREQ